MVKRLIASIVITILAIMTPYNTGVLAILYDSNLVSSKASIIETWAIGLTLLILGITTTLLLWIWIKWIIGK